MRWSADRFRSWLLLTACMAVLGAFWTGVEARGCSEPSPVRVDGGRSCCAPEPGAPCCCQEAADERHPSGQAASSATKGYTHRSSCGCVANPSSPADRPSRPSSSTSEPVSVSVAISPTWEPDARSRSFTAPRTPPFDPLGTSVLMRTSRFRF